MKMAGLYFHLVKRVQNKEFYIFKRTPSNVMQPFTCFQSLKGFLVDRRSEKNLLLLVNVQQISFPVCKRNVPNTEILIYFNL